MVSRKETYSKNILQEHWTVFSYNSGKFSVPLTLICSSEIAKYSSTYRKKKNLRLCQIPFCNSSSLESTYKLLFSPFLSRVISCEYLHLSPLPHRPCLKYAHTTDLGSASFDSFVATGLKS